MPLSGPQRITDLDEVLSLDNEDQFIIYQNSTGRSKRVKRGNLFLSRGIRVTGKFIDSESGNDVGLSAATALNNSATALISASGAQASADGKNKVYYSATEPSLASILGYINNTTLTVNSVTSGIPIYVGMPLIRASAPAVTAGTKVSAFLGTSGGQAGQYTVSISQTAGSAGSPISITGGDFEDGDIWYDIDDNYKQYVRNGSVWQASFAPMIRFGSSGIISGLLRADQNGDTSAMDFVLVADKFQVWNGTSAEVPFEIVPFGTSGQQVVRIKNAQIQNVDAGKITAGFIGAQVININGSSATGTAGAGGYIESTNFVPTWVSGSMIVRQYTTTGTYGAFLGKQSPSDVVQVKVAQANGSYKMFRSLQTQNSGTSPATNGPELTGGNNAYWQEVTIPTFNVSIGDETKTVENLGFRIVSNGFNEFTGALFRGAVIANEGFFGNTKNAVRLDSSGLTVGNNGYLKSRGIGYNGTEFFATSGTSGGFFLGNTQAEGQADLYQLFVGKPLGNSLWWNGNNLLVNGNLVAESASGSSGAGLTINSGFGIRYKDDNAVLTITGGKTNGSSSGAQIDLVGTRYENVNRGALVLSAGYLDPWPGTSGVNSGAIHFRTGNSLVGLWRSNKTFDIYSSVVMSGEVYAGNADPALAPFNISTSGVLTAKAAILQAAIINSTSAISSDSTLAGRVASIIASTIDANGDIINGSLNTATNQILDSFSFSTSGAIQIGAFSSGTSGDIKISPNGIVGRNSSGETTFSLNGVTGSATFAGQITALAGNIGGWVINALDLSKNNATISSTGVITLGTGGESVILSSVDTNNRIWVGNATSGLAPFRVSKSGVVTANGAILDSNSSIGGRSGTAIATAMDTSGRLISELINSSLNTETDQILSGFSFGASGAIQIGTFASGTSGDIRISPNGIVGRNSSGATTFSINGTSGAATFGGQLSAPSGTIGGWTINPSNLSNNNATISSDGNITLGTGQESVILSSVNADYRIWVGNSTSGAAPFRVSKSGVVTANGAVLDSNSTVGGRSGTAIASAMDTSGRLINDLTNSSFNTLTRQILAGFSFGTSGAIQIGTYSNGTSGDVRISPNGITGRNSSNVTTFSIDGTTGAATFGGQLSAPSGSIGGWTIGSNSLFAGASGSRVALESDSTSGNVVIYAGSETKASAPFRVTNTGNVTATLGTIGGWTIGSSALTAGSGITRVGLEVDGNSGGISIYAGSDTKTSAPFRVSNTGVLVAQSGQIGGWNLSSTSLETTSTAYIQAGPNAGNYVRISSSGIIGASSTLGTVFTIPTNGTKPTFSSGEITLTKFTISTSGIIETSTTVGNGLSNGQGVRINDTGIKGFKINDANPVFHLDATNGNITAKGGEIAGWTISASTLSKNSLTIDSAGNIRAGQTAYNTGTGFWLGIDGSTPKFSLGTSGGNRVTWDGSTLEITGTIKNASVGSAGGTDGLIINSPVGIRTANSNQTLTITGGTSNGITAGAQVDFTGSTVAEADNRFSLLLQAGGAVADLNNASNGRIEFRTNIANSSVNTGCIRADIRKNGALTFYKNQSYNGSTLTYTSGAGCAEFQSNVGIGRSFEQIDSSGNTTGKLHVQTEIAVYTGASTRQIVLTGSNGNISAAGDVSAVSFTTSSSKKVKTNIKKLKSGLETIDKLKPVSFKRKGTKQQDIGLIAEEVDEILPVIVKHNEKNEAEGLDYSKLTVLLINAVKELSAEVKRLEKKIKDANSN